MAFSRLFSCNACSHDEVLVHADEWTPGPNGAILPYPGAGSPVGGLVNRVWCPACGVVRPHVFVRLDPPGAHAVIAYAEAQRLNCDGNETGPCPVCQTPLTWDLDGRPCPACASGTLLFTGEWEDAV